MKLQDLHVLMAVVQSGSMSKAAALLNTGQSAISRSIADMEQSIGVRLLDRSPNGIEPTVYGQTLLEGGAVVFDELRQVVKKIEYLADPTAGEVRIGCSPLLAPSFVSALVDRVSSQHPRMKFQLLAAPIETVHRELIRRNLDVLITRRVGPIVDERLAFEFLFDDSLVVVAGAGHPWAQRRKVALSELAGEFWVLPPPDYVLTSDVMEAFRANGLPNPRVAVATISPDARLSLVATGRFLTILPASALKFPTPRPELRTLPIEVPMAFAPNGIVSLRDRTLNPAVQLFIENARELAKPLARRKRM
jgi:DNA-binding transcriptional LysR family regulator